MTTTATLGATTWPNATTIAIHVRRGDVTWLDKYGLPSHRWVDTMSVLDVLRGVREIIGVPLTPPAVQLSLHSERGWLRNDTQALRELAPGARVELDSSPTSTINAMVEMASADVLIIGSSGFSEWAGLFSCGIKLGSADTGKQTTQPSLRLPMRHVFVPTSLTARSSTPFAHSAAALAFRTEWQAYAACKANAACRPHLCGPDHLSDDRWRRSRLAREAVADAAAAQWRMPPPVAYTTSTSTRGGGGGAARHARGEALALGGAGRALPNSSWLASAASGAVARRSPALAELLAQCVRMAGARHHAGSSDPHAPGCLRQKWERNLSAFVGARKSVPRAPPK